MIKKIKNKIKSLLKKDSQYKSSPWTSFDITEQELRQRRISEKWSIEMISDFYKIDEKSLKEVFLVYNIK